MAECWICGGLGDSGEHLIKASDIRSRFGRVSPKEPVFLQTNEERNRRVLGMKSRALKSQAPLCRKCNNERTQPFDIAWEKLSAYLSARRRPARAGDTIRLQNVFPGAVRRSMLDVHLYFVKALGCKIVESGAPIDVMPFSQAIVQRRAHPSIQIAICPSFDQLPILASSEIYVDRDEASPNVAIWYYCLDHLNVRVAYLRQPTRVRSGYWHPDNVGKLLHVVRND